MRCFTHEHLPLFLASLVFLPTLTVVWPVFLWNYISARMTDVDHRARREKRKLGLFYAQYKDSLGRIVLVLRTELKVACILF